MTLQETIEKIRPLSREAMDAAWKRWNDTSIPLHSLGKLQDAVVRIAGMLRTPKVALDKKALVVMCADNGVVEEGISQSGQEVTKIIAENFLREKATAAIFCRKSGADVFPVDIGIASDTILPNYKVAYGTKNFAKEPAMTKEQAVRAIEVGIHMAEKLYDQGYRILATGEMGIGNTTTASAMAAALLPLSPEQAAGRGAGLSDEGLARKRAVIEDALRRYRLRERNPLEVLSHVGGFDIAGMTGAFIGGCMYGVPIVIDGMISAVAALTASLLCERAVGCMLASHRSREPAMAVVMERLGLVPVIDGDLALGEGTGAALLFPMLDMAERVYRNTETFEKMQIESYRKYD